MTAIAHVVTTRDQDTHRARCSVCGWATEPESGCNAGANTKRKALEHVTERWHEVTIDVTRQHGYRPAKSNPKASA